MTCRRPGCRRKVRPRTGGGRRQQWCSKRCQSLERWRLHVESKRAWKRAEGRRLLALAFEKLRRTG